MPEELLEGEIMFMGDPNLSSGILYVATGELYILAAIRSAKSVLKHCPSLPTHLYADWGNYDFDFGHSPYPFTSVGKIENPHRRSKLDYLSKTPFEQTLYLDTDTSLNEDIRDMFRVLERFDIALTHAHKRNTPERLRTWNLELPQAFPQYNSGVMLYRRTPAVIQFLEEWRDHYYQNLDHIRQDQMTLRELLWLSDLRMTTLPPEYNVRYIKYHILWSKAEATTKIFHLKQYHVGWFTWLFRPLTTRKMGIARRFGLTGFLDPKKKK
jgi:hypothetical protein